MERAGVVLIPDPSNESSILWSLKDLSSKAASICEIQSLEYTHSTSVYIDIGPEGHNLDDTNYYNVDLYCVPSGWFVSESVAWFKDGDPVKHGIGKKQLSLILKAPFKLEKVSEFQGYYRCSVDDEIRYEQIFSSKVLVRIPDFGNEKKIQKIFENSMNARNDILSELLNNFHVDKRDMSFRSTVSCPREKSYYNGWELNWPDTSIGQSTVPEEICVTDDDDPLERKCLGDFNVGGFWSPVRKACATVSSSVTKALHELSKTNITEDNILNSVVSVDSLISTSNSLSSADVTYVTRILRNVATVPIIKPEILKSVVHTVDTVINTMSAYDNRDSLSNVPNKISSAVDTIISNTETNDQVIKIAGNNIAVSVHPNNANASFILTGGVLESWGSNVTTLFNDSSIDHAERLDQFEMFEAAVLLPDNLLSRNQSVNMTNVAITIHKNYYFRENVEVISPLIDISIGNAPVYNVDPPVEMVFKVPENLLKENFSWGCVYWDKTMNDRSGGWSYEGCFANLLDSAHVQCYCDHLTSFAVILEINYYNEFAPVHRNLLNIITYIGCFLSIGLGSIILTFILFSKWRSDVKHKVLFNLSLSLFLFLFIFVCGIERIGSKHGCMVVALLLHNFMLSSFSWMLVEAVLQYYGLVKVIGTYIPHFIQKASFFAWGLPLIIVVAVLSVDHGLYSGRNEYCWVSEKAFFYAVAPPVLLMLAINFVIFGVISYSITCGRSKQYLRSNQSDKQEMIARTKAVFCVSVLLGLSWVFGFLAAMEGVELIFQYLFTVTTTLQGFLFFIFFVLRQKKTRDLWLTFLKGPKPHISRNTGGTETESGESQQEPVQNKLHRVSYKAKMPYVILNR
ncbi:Adhesion G-protein coupled receptor G6 like protein [Argiope bruennichi]|uniref:Adhesion G-protein coupled receptor G6 like protein n=1 Tax=Argiope bruennichi TaxID=94029 RepID=A0A8T0E195_ARGBR|nr:Adhesion G-protein coupled receptor G6 like protein [Argiope bruennichi]